MSFKHEHISYKETHSFSPLVIDYLNGVKELNSFYNYSPDISGIGNAIDARAKYPVNREVLVKTLQEQYSNLNTAEVVKSNIAALAGNNTYTICTAHQPNLVTGYLYFIYKIVHAIKLADELNKQYSDKHFVPVYYMGSEDNDLDELGTFRYAGKRYTWDAEGQKGAVGRMNTKSLKPLLDELFRVLGPPGEHTEQLKEILTEAYLKHDNISDATTCLVNELFGKYGLVVLNPDSAAFKREIITIMEDDMLNHTAVELVNKQAEALGEKYKVQAYPRDINLFYLKDGLRERIERVEGKWMVLNTELIFSRDELSEELNSHPERFSPNVILRGVLQERILPDVAFIGGGAEVAYWLQLKPVFEHYNTFYPVILLRQSVQFINEKATSLKEKLSLNTTDIFKGAEELYKNHVTQNSDSDRETSTERESIEEAISSLKAKAVAVDSTLESSAEAALTKMVYQLEVLEKKMMRAEKRKYATDLQRIDKLKEILFPNGLQERTENFISYYTLYGTDFIDYLYKATMPLENEFLVVYH